MIITDDPKAYFWEKYSPAENAEYIEYDMNFFVMFGSRVYKEAKKSVEYTIMPATVHDGKYTVSQLRLDWEISQSAIDDGTDDNHLVELFKQQFISDILELAEYGADTDKWKNPPKVEEFFYKNV